jgi:hypothetical protein
VQQGLQDPQNKALLQRIGLTDEVTAAVTEIISKLDADLVLRDGKISVETQLAGESQPRRLSLKAPGGLPTSITDLLRRSQFDQVVSAFTNNDPVYLEAVASAVAVDYEPADLYALGAVAARQRMAEHVRKLEDTGLATYQGNDPVSLTVGLIIAGLALGAFGAYIEYLCDHQHDLPPLTPVPDWVCAVGETLLFLSLVLLITPLLLGLPPGVPDWVVLSDVYGFGFFLWDAVVHLDPNYLPTM